MLSLNVSRPVQAPREAGVQVALDDVASGFSNLAPIARLAPERLAELLPLRASARPVQRGPAVARRS